MRITEGHRQIAEKARDLAKKSRHEVTEPEWAQDRDGDFLICYVNGNRRALDFTEEQIAGYPGDEAGRRTVDEQLEAVIGAGAPAAR
jgi:hypothetical protein